MKKHLFKNLKNTTQRNADIYFSHIKQKTKLFKWLLICSCNIIISDFFFFFFREHCEFFSTFVQFLCSVVTVPFNFSSNLFFYFFATEFFLVQMKKNREFLIFRCKISTFYTGHITAKKSNNGKKCFLFCYEIFQHEVFTYIYFSHVI